MNQLAHRWKDIRFSPRVTPAVAIGIALCASGLAAAQSQSAPALKIQVLDAQGAQIAASVPANARQREVRLSFAHIYRPGDRIDVSGPERIAVQLDSGQPECRLYRQRAGAWSFEIPFGHGQMDPGGAYDPNAFQGTAHKVGVRVPGWRELRGYRNLALNPCDQPAQPESPAFPHATASSTYREMPVFAPRNAIDGVVAGGNHGGWPYQSWGPDKVDGLWWRADFGRIVELDKLRIAVRSDFPHDSYWKEATIEFSDGTQVKINLAKSAGLQEIRFPLHRTAWIRLSHLMPAEEPGWCAFTEVEAWGRDIR